MGLVSFCRMVWEGAVPFDLASLCVGLCVAMIDCLALFEERDEDEG